MKKVNVAKFKAELSKYLHFVRRGGELVILDRVTPIARVTPCPTAFEETVEIEEPNDDPKTLFYTNTDPIKGIKTNSLKFLLEEKGDR